MMINKIILSVLFGALSSGFCVSAASCLQSDRSESAYYCRMPRPGGNHGHNGQYGACDRACYSPDFRALFGDMRLSSKQLHKLEKAYSKYDKDMRKIHERMRHSSRRGNNGMREAVAKCASKFDSEVRRTLDRRQYALFERRFRPAWGAPRRGSSAPRPGAYVYDCSAGQCCLLADSTRQECPGEQDAPLEMQSQNGLGPIEKGPAPRLMTGKGSTD